MVREREIKRRLKTNREEEINPKNKFNGQGVLSGV